jgi:transposase
VRVTTAFNRMLDLPGVSVSDVSFGEDRIIVDVTLKRRRLACPEAGCDFTTRSRYDRRPVSSCWRHLDLGKWGLVVRAGLRRLHCPEHGVKTEQVPFARHHSGFTRDFEDVIAYLATRTDKTTITRLQRVDWHTVGRICARTVADGVDPDRLDGLVAIGVDEVSWKKHHNYLTLVTDHTGRKIVWGAEGKDSETFDEFFAELGPERAARLEAVSMDMGPAFAKSARKEGHAINATICIDPFHAVKLVGEALDVVRREVWNEMRQLPDPEVAKKFKGARWSLLKNPENLTEDQATTLRRLKRKGGGIWRAYRLKESFRAIFAGDLDADEAGELIDRWISQAQRSQLPAFTRVAKTIRKFRDGILASIRLKINNGRAEGLNNHVRLLIRRAYGFHTATAALALVMLTCGPITLVLPWERPPTRT